MTTRSKLLIGIGFCLIGLLVASALGIRYLLVKSLPETKGSLRLPGLSAPVDVYRDDAGVPHVLAANEYDMYVAQGFVHAQDRLWQMDLMRRYGQGRLAEIFGSIALPADRLMRTIGIADIADTLARTISPQSRKVLDAYSRGVNAYIESEKGRYPVEFDLLQYTPEPWTPQHSLICGRLMGWELSFAWWVDLVFGDLVERVGPEKAREIIPDIREGEAIRSLPDAGAMSRAADGFRSAFLAARRLFGQGGFSIGSNAWAVTRSKSMTGSAVLANDPHLPLTQPARWYIMHLAAAGAAADRAVNVAGASLPGVPGIIIGHNDSIAWGMTNIMADDADFYLEDVSFRDSTCALNGGRIRMTVRSDSIFVRDSAGVALTIHRTPRGPLVDGVYLPDALAGRNAKRRSVSFRWTGAGTSDELLCIFRLNRARSWSDFLGALSTFACPGQQFTYADRAGNIGSAIGARLPVRSTGPAYLPFDASAGDGTWTGSVPFERLPRSVNPPGDFVVAANTPDAEGYPYYVSNLWETDSRFTRIRELLSEQRSFAARDFRLLQMDVRSPYARAVKPYFVRALLAMRDRPNAVTRAMNALAQWDGSMSASSWEATIFNASMGRALAATFEDELGAPLYQGFLSMSNIPLRVFPRLLADTATTWFDDTRTAEIESRDRILRTSVRGAIAELSARFGMDMRAWRWGQLHRVTFRHPLGSVPPLDRLFNIGPFQIGGHATTINNGEYLLGRPYDVVVGPSLRMIVDMRSPDTCSIILPTGQSGQPLSPHYGDLTALWQNGAYHSLVSDPETIRSAVRRKLTLTP